MKTNVFTRIAGTTLFVLTLAGATVRGVGPAAQDRAPGKFEGTWLNAVQIVTCPPAPFAVIAAFESMQTYLRGGIQLEGGGPPVPAVSRSAGHGIWQRTGRHTFLQFFRSHSFDSLGRRVRVTEVTGDLRLIRGDNPDTPDVEPYYLRGDGTNKITNLNPVDGSVISVLPEGCNKVTSVPFLFRN